MFYVLPGSTPIAEMRGLDAPALKAPPPSSDRSPPQVASRLVNMTETEVNDMMPQLIPLDPDPSVDLAGTIALETDVDLYRISLNKGDVLGVAVLGPGGLDPVVELLDAVSFNLLVRNDDEQTPLYPTTSPLPVPVEALDAALSFVAPTGTDYVIRVTSFNQATSGTYTLQIRKTRPFLESAATDVKQVVFVDFDGANINPNLLFNRGNGSAALSPMSNFLTAWGLTAADEGAVIDGTMAVIRAHFDALRQPALNGNRPVDGVPGHFDVEFRNSRDNADTFGQPYVSRVIIGGTSGQTGIADIVLAEPVDPGNFNPQDTGVVTLNVLSAPLGGLNSINSLTLGGGFTKIQAVSRVLGNLACHALGHLLGAFNTEDLNATLSLMDDIDFGATLAGIAGAGADTFLGTFDDRAVEFVTDDYNDDRAYSSRGTENVAIRIAYALSTGGVISGGGGGPPPTLRPDLFISVLTVGTANLVAGSPFSVTVQVSNAGAAAATNFWVAIFLDQANPTSSAGAAAVQGIAVLGPGANTTLTFDNLVYPQGGDFTLSVLADSDHQILEGNENNNTYIKRVRVNSVGPDLAIKSITKAETTPGLDAAFTVIIENRGSTAAGAFNVGYYVSRVNAPGTADVPSQSTAVAGLAALGTTTLNFTMPARTTPGAGWAWFFADHANAVAEDIETNNTSYATWGVANDPIVVSSDVTASQNPAIINQPVTISVGATDPNGDTLFYEWDFGDGTTLVNGSSVTHTYAAAGIYTVTVKISDGPFNSIVKTFLIEVTDEEVIDLGQVSLAVRKGAVKLTVPVPAVFNKKADRPRSKLISGNPGPKVKYRNYKLRGKAKDKGVYVFVIEHVSRNKQTIKRLKYKYTVVD
jgi:hypothetical protein